jgi:CubicO group peptidase (beta-lactamase class C family)
LAAATSVAAQYAFPGTDWSKADAARLGWSVKKLASAEALMRQLGSTSLMIVQRGEVVAAWGDTTRRVRVASVRKSILSALYGLAVAEGKINLEATLAELEIDDKPPSLTAEEKRAKVRDLLQARSGVYHEATSETEDQTERRPDRGSHPPGTFWYYNNWDFNALGSIYRKLTGEDIFVAVERRIASPIGMQDFSAADGRYALRRASSSIHPAYHMNMSARDLARFGLLFLNQGQWNGRQVIPKEWVAESTRSYSVSNRKIGYGYMWWVSDGEFHYRTRFGPGSYSARGYGGQLILVAPHHDLVIVHLTEAYQADRQYGEILARIMAAAPVRR